MRRVIVENSGRRGKLESREEGVVIAEHTRDSFDKTWDTQVRRHGRKSKAYRGFEIRTKLRFAHNATFSQMQKYHSCPSISISPSFKGFASIRNAREMQWLPRFVSPLDYANEGTRSVVPTFNRD